jgi:hypothetical protein
LEEYGDPHVEREEANAANADGEAVMRAEREAAEADAAAEEARITALVKRWPVAITVARESVREAQEILGDLDDCEELPAGHAQEARRLLGSASGSLYDAEQIAASRLRTVEDAERDAELTRLRAENSRLAAALAKASRG